MRSSVDLGKHSSGDLAKPPLPSLERVRTSLEHLRRTSLEHTCLLFLFSPVVILRSCGAEPRGARVE